MKQASPPAGGFRSIADTTLVEGGTAKGNNDDGSPVSDTWRPTMMRYAPMLALERLTYLQGPLVLKGFRLGRCEQAWAR